MAAYTGLTQQWVAQRLPARGEDAHKGTFGRVLVVAGSLEYAGAACWPAWAPRDRRRARLHGIAGVGGARLLGRGARADAMLLAEEAPGLIGPAGWRRVAPRRPAYDALVVGPGLGRQPGTQRRVRGFIAELRRRW